MIQTQPRGTLKPDLVVTIGDADGDANFTGITTSMVNVKGEQGGTVKFNAQADAVTPSADGKSCTVAHYWVSGETGTAGRMWVTVDVTWPTGKVQTFPAGTPLRLDIVRAAGDS